MGCNKSSLKVKELGGAPLLEVKVKRGATGVDCMIKEKDQVVFFNIIGCIICQDEEHFVEALLSNLDIIPKGFEAKKIVDRKNYILEFRDSQYKVENLGEPDSKVSLEGDEIQRLIERIVRSLKGKFLEELCDFYYQRLREIVTKERNQRTASQEKIFREESKQIKAGDLNQRVRPMFSSKNPKRKTQGRSFQTVEKYGRGLPNLGNTCYLNSSLLSCRDFINVLENGRISSQLKKVFTEMESGSEASIRSFIRSLTSINPVWGNSKPQDCKDFLLFLLKVLNDDRNDCNSVFSWVIKKSLRMHCNHEIELHQNHILTTLRTGSLSESIRVGFLKRKRTETAEYQSFYCEKCCKDFPCRESLELVSTPKYAIFYREPKSEYLDNLHEIEAISVESSILELQALILLHTYTATVRHYTSLCRRMGEWVLFNDSSVSRFHSEQVGGAYLLFYEIRQMG